MTRICWVDKPTYLNDDFIAAVSALGKFHYYSDIPGEAELIQRLSNCDIGIIEWSSLSRRVIEQIQNVQYLLLVTTAFDSIDLETLTEKNILVSNCPEYSSQAVAEWLLAGLLMLNRHMIPSWQAAKRGEAHLYPPFLGKQLKGRTLGLVGTGSIGQVLAKLAEHLELRLIGCNNSGHRVPGIIPAQIEEIFQTADFVSIQIPHNKQTKGCINKTLLAAAKKGQYIVSCSRGSVFDLDALHEAIKAKRIAGAVLDDLSLSNHPLLSCDNVIVNTGIAWYTEEARQANLDFILRALKAYLNQQPLFLLKGTSKNCPSSLLPENSPSSRTPPVRSGGSFAGA